MGGLTTGGFAREGFSTVGHITGVLATGGLTTELTTGGFVTRSEEIGTAAMRGITLDPVVLATDTFGTKTLDVAFDVLAAI